MRILLIKPPIHAFHKLTAGSRHVPTGLMYLAHASAKLDLEVRIFDSLIHTSDTHIIPKNKLNSVELEKIRRNPIFKNVIHFGASWKRIYDAVDNYQPDVVGITCLFSPYYRQAYQTASIVRKASPRAKILMGGPHATVMYNDVFEHSDVDGVVLGEGERIFGQLLSAMKSDPLLCLGELDLSHFPGLAVRKSSGEIDVNGRRDFISDLDQLGFPTIDQIEFSQYNNCTSIITSRGCPFSCTFCSVHAIVGSSFRARSPDSVIEELKYYTKRGVRVFNIEDDNFTFNINRVDSIMDLICRSGIDVELRFPNGITAIKMTEERLQLMARAGVKKLFFGLESADEHTRRALKKPFANMEHIEELIHAAKRTGIDAFASLITGLPDQTLDDMAYDFVQLFERGMGASANPYYPITGTELYRRVEAAGILEMRDAEWYEPMNFPIAGKSFDRSDVADAFCLGIALSDGHLKRFHADFLNRSQLPTAVEVTDALIKCGISVAGVSERHLDLRPRFCFCHDQDLIKRPLVFTADLPNENVCMFSGRILKSVIELWTLRHHNCEEIQCAATSEADRCSFRLTPTNRPLTGIIRCFLAKLSSQSTNAVS